MPGARRSQSAWPRVSDHVVETETDFELFQGQIREVSHAGPLHGRQLSQVNFVLGAYRDDEAIADPCLFQPVPVRALLDAVEADDAVAQALLGKENRVLIEYGDTRARRALQKVLQLLLRDRGIVIDTDADARIAACNDLDELERWIVRAAQVTSASELFGDD